MMVVVMVVVAFPVMMLIMIMIVVMVMLIMIVVMVMLIMIVVMLMLIVVMLFLLFVVNRLHHLYPSGRGSHLLEIEESRMDNLVEINIAEVAVDDFRMGLDLPDDGTDASPFFGCHLRCLVEQDDVAELHLLNDQVGEVFLSDLRFGEVIAARKLITQAEGIHHSDDGIERGHPFVNQVGIKAWIGTDGLGDGTRLTDAAGLDDDIVEEVLRHQSAELVYQIRLQGATDTSVLQRHEAVVLLVDHPTLFDERGIDVHFADIIDDDGKLDSLLVGENPVEKRCLSASEIPRQE